MFFLLRLNLLIILNIKLILAEYNEIDLSYILNADYMPGSLLVLENPQYNENRGESSNNNNTDLFEYYGTFDEALNTMDYHRKMMNEYLCRNYLSEQIITEMKSNRIKRRLGSPANKRDNLQSKINFSIRSNLLEDEGSSKYQNWLKNSATLQDIYRHYDNTAQNREFIESGKDGNQGSEEFEGQITGFGYQQSSGSNSPAKLGNSASGSGYSYQSYPTGNIYSGAGSSGSGLYNGHSSYGQGGGGGGGGGGGFNNHAEHIIIAETTGGQSSHGYGGHDNSPKHQGDSKEKLADLFEIALTALAFLSFGMFIIQVIMCICMTTTTTAPVVTMMPMSMSPTGTGMNDNSMMGGGEATGGGGMAEGGGEGDADTGTSGRGESELSSDITEIDDGNIEETFDNGEGEYKIILTYDNSGNTADGISNGGYARNTGDGSVGTGGSGTGSGTGTGTAEESSMDDGKRKIKYKSKRDIPTITQPNNEALNELARRILISIEAALIAHQDGGNCLRNTLCENNVYSRSLADDQKYWIPVWSLGMSWLSGKLIRNGSRSTNMLDTLKSALLGLGNADCELMYSKCELQKERQKRLNRKR